MRKTGAGNRINLLMRSANPDLLKVAGRLIGAMMTAAGTIAANLISRSPDVTDR